VHRVNTRLSGTRSRRHLSHLCCGHMWLMVACAPSCSKCFCGLDAVLPLHFSFRTTAEDVASAFEVSLWAHKCVDCGSLFRKETTGMALAGDGSPTVSIRASHKRSCAKEGLTWRTRRETSGHLKTSHWCPSATRPGRRPRTKGCGGRVIYFLWRLRRCSCTRDACESTPDDQVQLSFRVCSW